METMKYFMVIDGAQNSTHDVFCVGNSMFEIVFPEGTDIAFLDDVTDRVRSLGLGEIDFFEKLYSNLVDKKNILGLHGILHSTGSYCRKECFPTRKEAETIKDGRLT
jgi:hypothetical protein